MCDCPGSSTVLPGGSAGWELGWDGGRGRKLELTVGTKEQGLWGHACLRTLEC